MAAKTPRTIKPKNTSAPATPDKIADVMVKEAEKSASQALRPDAGKQSSESPAVPPAGADIMADRLIVASKIEGFRRGGRAWSKASETVSMDLFNEQQLAALIEEPMLDIVFLAKDAA